MKTTQNQSLEIQVQTIEFHGHSLITIERDGKIYVAMKPIVQSIGLIWHGQLELIKRDSVLSEGIRIIRMPSDGGIQDTVCLPLDFLNGYLFKVDVSRSNLSDSQKELFHNYQRECYRVLRDHFFKNKKSTNPYTDQLPKNYIEALEAHLNDQKTIMRMESEAKINQPKVEFHDSVVKADGTHTIEETAKILDCGRNIFFRKLREMAILKKDNLPYQHYIDSGYFLVRERPFKRGGIDKLYAQTIVTGKGLIWLQKITGSPLLFPMDEKTKTRLPLIN